MLKLQQNGKTSNNEIIKINENVALADHILESHKSDWEKHSKSFFLPRSLQIIFEIFDYPCISKCFSKIKLADIRHQLISQGTFHKLLPLNLGIINSKKLINS